MNGKLFLPRTNTMPGQYQPNNFYLEDDINELNRLRNGMIVRSQNGFGEDEIAVDLSNIAAILTNLNSDLLTGVDQLGFTISYVDTVTCLVEFCNQYIDTPNSKKIASLRVTIIDEGWKRFNHLPNRQFNKDALELKAYEFFIKAGYLNGQNYRLYNDQELDQLFMENKKQFLDLFLEHFNPPRVGRRSTLSLYMDHSFSKEVELYTKLHRASEA